MNAGLFLALARGLVLLPFPLLVDLAFDDVEHIHEERILAEHTAVAGENLPRLTAVVELEDGAWFVGDRVPASV